LKTFGTDARAFLQKQINVPLYSDYHSPFWVQHRDCLNLRIDVVLIRLSATHLGADMGAVVSVSDYGFAPLFHYVGVDVLIIGYPFDDPPPKFPVWKRGQHCQRIGGRLAQETRIPCRLPYLKGDVRVTRHPPRVWSGGVS
jgi:hypothetical protein